MAESVGQTLGHCRIVENIGAGAASEVWRAQDMRLDCRVQVIVVPTEVVRDQERLAFAKPRQSLRSTAPASTTTFVERGVVLWSTREDLKHATL